MQRDQATRFVRAALVATAVSTAAPALAQVPAPGSLPAAPTAPPGPAPPSPAVPLAPPALSALPASPPQAGESLPAELPPSPVPAAPATAAGATASQAIAAVVGTRLAARIQDPWQTEELNDLALDGELQVLAAGQVHPLLKWQAGLVGSFGGLDGRGEFDRAGQANLLELVGKLEVHEALNLWFGRLLVPADRATLSTAWSSALWTLPGDYVPGRPRLAPRQNAFGRGEGAVLWGQIDGGRFKYHVGALGLADPLDGVLYSTRLGLNLLDPEPGYRSASTYFGDKDILALGLSLQYQADGSVGYSQTAQGQPPIAVAWDDYTDVGLDILLEKRLRGVGVITLEGSFHKTWGENEPASYHWFALFGYLLPIEVGAGRFQPLFRFQHARLENGDDARVFDSQLGYVIDGSSACLALLYKYGRTGDATSNAIIAGLQLATR